MLIRIGVADETQHVHDLSGALRVLLADVPVQREGMAKAGDEFPAVKFALRSESATIERFRHTSGLALGTAPVVIHLVLLKFEMEIHTQFCAVIEDNAPLV